MTGCSAPNCTNHSRNGFRFYRFPADPDRRNQWLINCRRKQWNPTQNDRLCSEHFEAGQTEKNRNDGKNCLKPNAVPTIFKVTNPPKLLDAARKSAYKRQAKTVEDFTTDNIPHKKRAKLNEFNTTLNEESTSNLAQPNQEDLVNENQFLKEKIHKLESKMSSMENAVGTFISKEQFENVAKGRKRIKKWTNEGILRGLKHRFGLGKNGYIFFSSTGYPTPSYSTLNKRISAVTVSFGFLTSAFNLLVKKVESMKEIERDCSLMVDEMEISGNLDFDKSKKCFIGKVTLGDKAKIGNHLTAVVLRGLNTPWKQMVACHITGPSTSGNDMKNLIINVIEACKSIGLNIVNVSSDMGSNSKALWASLGVTVTKSERIFSFDCCDSTINVEADAPHLLKNWKNALQNSVIYLPSEIVNEEHLPSSIVNAIYI